jgi:hypothetical protein
MLTPDSITLAGHYPLSTNHYIRRWQDANVREVRRLTNLLLKIQRRGGKMGAPGASVEDLVCHDVPENKRS